MRLDVCSNRGRSNFINDIFNITIEFSRSKDDNIFFFPLTLYLSRVLDTFKHVRAFLQWISHNFSLRIMKRHTQKSISNIIELARIEIGVE